MRVALQLTNGAGGGLPTGTPPEEAKLEARKWLLRAAELGHPQAQFSFACFHHWGVGTPHDGQAAVEWYRKAAKQGHAGAFFACGTWSSNNSGNAAFLQQAADAGHTAAALELALIHREGRFVEQSHAAAFPLFQVAAGELCDEQKEHGALLPIQLSHLPLDLQRSEIHYELAAGTYVRGKANYYLGESYRAGWVGWCTLEVFERRVESAWFQLLKL